ncbi:hydrogen peroxide-inducible genes activator [Fulvivirga ligni]|uniref:hydrogen peroxide-inducible genes activator n=1 Tax=Fulvivirga ligni TaxID=2904246 RepID=UPI001F4135BD|nr:hydrogen peroxide-inducible genes activator [Fulvivirga ligni]UII21679.1 hydrogen peroxide-inducible genes activator [Fulvivirga ligni]
MTLTQLEYLVTLNKTKSFSKAAKQCHVTQPNLSMQIHKLEQELGVLLLDRSKNEVIPTKTGKVLIEKAQNILREANGFMDYLKSEKNDLTGTYRIGIIPTLAPYLVPLFLPEFMEKYPKTRLIIEEIKTDDIIELLHQDKLDLGVAVTPLKEKKIKEIPIFMEPIYAYISKGHALSNHKTINEEDLREHQVWLLNHGHCFRNQALNLCKQISTQLDDYEFVYESGSLETLKNLVSMNHGITLLPALAAYTNVESLEMVKKFAAPEPVREVSLIVHQNCIKDHLIKALYETIIDKIPNEYQVKYKNNRVIHWR